MNMTVSTTTATTLEAFPDDALYVLRDAADLMSWAADQIDPDRRCVSGPNAVEVFRWAVMKMIEANDTLPDGVRGDLSRECFMPDRNRLRGDFRLT